MTYASYEFVVSIFGLLFITLVVLVLLLVLMIRVNERRINGMARRIRLLESIYGDDDE